jgi:hypothetical protein
MIGVMAFDRVAKGERGSSTIFFIQNPPLGALPEAEIQAISSPVGVLYPPGGGLLF